MISVHEVVEDIVKIGSGVYSFQVLDRAVVNPDAVPTPYCYIARSHKEGLINHVLGMCCYSISRRISRPEYTSRNIKLLSWLYSWFPSASSTRGVRRASGHMFG